MVFEDAIVQDRVKIYLDGLNEMGQNGKDKSQELYAWVHQRANQQDKFIPKRIIVSCRTEEYCWNSSLDLDLPRFDLGWLTENDVLLFIKKFGREAESADIVSLLGNLGRTPWLLRKYLELRQFKNSDPREKHQQMTLLGEIFSSLTMAFLERLQQREWELLQSLPSPQMRNDAEKLNQRVLKQLCKLAYRMVEQGLALNISEKTALETLQPEILERAFQTELVKITGSGEKRFVEFSHQFLFEFFAASELFSKENITELLKRQNPIWKWDNLELGQWDSTIVACAIYFDSSKVISDLLEAKKPSLAAECIHNILDSDDELIKRTIVALIGEISTDPIKYIAYISPEFKGYKAELDPSFFAKRYIASKALERIGLRSLPELRKIADNQKNKIVERHFAIETIGYLGDPADFDRLKAISVEKKRFALKDFIDMFGGSILQRGLIYGFILIGGILLEKTISKMSENTEVKDEIATQTKDQEYSSNALINLILVPALFAGIHLAQKSIPDLNQSAKVALGRWSVTSCQYLNEPKTVEVFSSFQNALLAESDDFKERLSAAQAIAAMAIIAIDYNKQIDIPLEYRKTLDRLLFSARQSLLLFYPQCPPSKSGDILNALSSLAQINDTEIYELLITPLCKLNEDVELQILCLKSLGKLHPMSYYKTIIKYFDQWSPKVQSVAIKALLKFQEPSYVNFLKQLLSAKKQPPVTVSITAIEAIVEIANTSANEQACNTILVALDLEIKSSRSIIYKIKQFLSPSPVLRELINAAGLLKIRDAEPRLIYLASMKNSKIKKSAVDALSKLEETPT